MDDSQRITNALADINSSISDLSKRLSVLEVSRSKSGSDSASAANVDVNEHAADTDGSRSTGPSRHDDTSSQLRNDNTAEYTVPPYEVDLGPFSDVQRDYESIRDSLTRVSLPQKYKVHDSAKGISKEGKPTLNVISKCARFAEAGLKVVASLQPEGETDQSITLKKDDVQKFFTIYAAQINFLQGEYAGLVVKSTFDEETSRIFKSFENNSGAFTDSSLQNIRLAAELANQRSQSGRFRGTGRGWNST